MWDMNGRTYIDFFSGAGALNYGHNNPRMKEKLIQYIQQDGIIHSLDMGTIAKAQFLEKLQEVIVKPRHLAYKVMFPGPTGTNAVESALKLARKATGRTTVVAFTNAFHGMTLGSLAVTGNRFKRNGAGVPLSNVVTVPYDNYLGSGFDSAEYLEQMLEDGGSGMSLPAAVIVETVQGEGGIHVARAQWLRRIEALCRQWEMALIVDDVQVGCGRTGTFFSFEEAGLSPDIVCLSKSISGFGLPMAINLIKPELDVFEPGEHNGTFRGHNAAFVTASEALEYWRTDALSRDVQAKAAMIQKRLQGMTKRFSAMGAQARGRGFIWGLALEPKSLAGAVSREAFKRGLVLETSGPDSEVLKLLPALTIDKDTLEQGLAILEDGLEAVARQYKEGFQ